MMQQGTIGSHYCTVHYHYCTLISYNALVTRLHIECTTTSALGIPYSTYNGAGRGARRYAISSNQAGGVSATIKIGEMYCSSSIRRLYPPANKTCCGGVTDTRFAPPETSAPVSEQYHNFVVAVVPTKILVQVHSSSSGLAFECSHYDHRKRNKNKKQENVRSSNDAITYCTIKQSIRGIARMLGAVNKAHTRRAACETPMAAKCYINHVWYSVVPPVLYLILCLKSHSV